MGRIGFRSGPHVVRIEQENLPPAKITERSVARRIGTGGYHRPGPPFLGNSYPMQACEM